MWSFLGHLAVGIAVNPCLWVWDKRIIGDSLSHQCFAAVSWNMPGAVVPRANAMCSCTLASTGVFCGVTGIVVSIY